MAMEEKKTKKGRDVGTDEDLEDIKVVEATKLIIGLLSLKILLNI